MTEKLKEFLKKRGSPFNEEVVIERACPSEYGLKNPKGFCKNQLIVSKENCHKCWEEAERQLK